MSDGDSDNKKLVNFNAPEETVETAKAKLEYGEMSERLRETLEQIAHGADVAEQTRMKDQLQEKRKDRREIESDIRRLQDERDEVDQDIERLEQRLDELADQEGEYDGFLKSIEADLHDGMHVWETHAKVEQAAQIGQTTPEAVLDDLRERNPTIPEEQYAMKDAV